MERFERETFHDRGKSAEMWAGLEGRSEVDQRNPEETAALERFLSAVETAWKT